VANGSERNGLAAVVQELERGGQFYAQGVLCRCGMESIAVNPRTVPAHLSEEVATITSLDLTSSSCTFVEGNILDPLRKKSQHKIAFVL
jgi:hypothetical protein